MRLQKRLINLNLKSWKFAVRIESNKSQTKLERSKDFLVESWIVPLQTIKRVNWPETSNDGELNYRV